jgi:integrase
MRPSEVESLHWANISPSGFVEIFSAKHRERGKLSRLCRITDGIRGCLEREVTSRLEGSDLIFKSITGSPLNKDMRARAMKYACEALGIEPRPFYSTRRGTATEMFKAGYDVAKIAGQLGHKDIKTTMIYIRPSMKETAEAFRGF